MDWSEYADVNELFADGVNDITRYLRKRNSGTRQALAVDFTSAFAGTSSWKGRYAVPYESVHTSEEGLMFQDAYHEVFQLYKANTWPRPRLRFPPRSPVVHVRVPRGALGSHHCRS